jgi:transketolase
MQVLRPADAIETAECWQIALETAKGPSVIALTRQNVPTVRGPDGAGIGDENLCKRGAYVLAGEAANPIRLIASGSEVQLALAARDLLARGGLAAAVVSMPSWELFAAQSDTYRSEVMGGDGTVRVACEAASGFGWERWLGARGAFVGMKGFGASAKAADLYRHFGITAEAIAQAARRLAG